MDCFVQHNLSHAGQVTNYMFNMYVMWSSQNSEYLLSFDHLSVPFQSFKFEENHSQFSW